MSYHFRLGYENYVWEQKDRVTLLSGSVVGGVIGNLRTKQLGRRVKLRAAADGESIQIEWRGGTGIPSSIAREVQLVGLTSLSAPQDGGGSTMQFDFYSGATLVATEGFTVGVLERFARHNWAMLGQSWMVDRVVVTISNTHVTRLEVTTGPLWVGPLWQPPGGVAPGWRYEQVDRGEMRETNGGQGYERRRPSVRQMSGSMSIAPFDETFAAFDLPATLPTQWLLALIGNTRRVAVFPRTLTPEGAIYTTVLRYMGFVGYLSQAGRIVEKGGGNFAWEDWTFRELL